MRPESNDSGNRTPEALLGGHATNGSISQPSAKSNAPDENSFKRKALPDTTESVGKAKTQYTPKLGDKIFTTKTRTYIEAVDERLY